MEQAPRTAGVLKGKVFRPLLCWFVLSFVLVTWRHHQQQERKATIEFTVSVEGRNGFVSHEAELNQFHFASGRRSGLGRKELTIRAANAEPYITNLFVWYGGKNLGNIKLARSRGTLELKVTPAALSVAVIGQEANTNLNNATTASISFPTGHYKVKAQFARFSTESQIEVTRNSAAALVIDPGVTIFALDSQPTSAEFELKSIAFPNLLVRSNTPNTMSDLPAGDYALRIWHRDYEKSMPVRLHRNVKTNELTVTFDYGRLTIVSEPSAAEIRNGTNLLGTTPAELSLPTALYRLSVAKKGYVATNIFITLRVNETSRFSLNLLSRSYVEALDEARDLAWGTSVNLDRALEKVNKALEIKPGDEAALVLKRAITFQRHLRDAREHRRNGDLAKALQETDSALQIAPDDPDALALKQMLEKEQQSIAQARAEARRELPGKVFEQAVMKFSHHELFPSEKMQLTGELASIRTQLVEILERNPAWNVRRQEVTQQGVAIVQAEIKGFGSRQTVLLVAGQTAENEVTIHFKLWTYTLGNNIQVGFTGISDDSYKPLHSSYATAATAPGVEQRRVRELDDFKRRISNGLR